ncbi:hypothetical protein Tdes44962_MAKER06167 [Teratosphaeria destructans]|uniref:Thymidylate kinase n=1 Tax=Teratosphaeria destructans TaxID=418781 RepID=A0A9W7VXQ3_9PEZI|nr:hypothetical protein Tdes44962_MAKER06167 [Teratosphaeria destructans]
MATHAPIARVPFAPLDSQRLQRLASAKNRQNGLISKPAHSAGKIYSSTNLKSTATPPPKRLASSLDRDFDIYDGENVDPAAAALSSPSKKSKSSDFTFSLAKSTASMPPPATIPSRLSTPIRANLASPRATLTAPAGRSPKRKLGAGRRVSAPFKRIDPPTFARNSSASSLMPFSLDAAISNTLGKDTRPIAGSTVQESTPKNWFFDIYEDSPDEEAATLMEHSTLTLDLSSDDEDSKPRDERGKENMAPEGYDAPTASRPAGESTDAAVISEAKRVKKADIIRKKVLKPDEMDDGMRSPLSDLETDDFFPEGLNKDSHVIIPPTPAKDAAQAKDVALFAAPVACTGDSTSRASSGITDAPVVTKIGDVKGEIVIFEDDFEPSVSRMSAVMTPAKGVTDENATPA